MLNYEFNVNIIVQLPWFQCFAVASGFLTQRTTSGVSHCKELCNMDPLLYKCRCRVVFLHSRSGTIIVFKQETKLQSLQKLLCKQFEEFKFWLRFEFVTRRPIAETGSCARITSTMSCYHCWGICLWQVQWVDWTSLHLN